MNRSKPSASDTREREKTKRLYAMLIAGSILGVLAIVLFFSKFGSQGSGKLIINEKGLEITLEQPLVKQLETESTEFLDNGTSIRVTTGTIDSAVVHQIIERKKEAVKPGKFSGKNLIDQQGKFVLAAADAEGWNVHYSKNGYTNSSIPIVELTSIASPSSQTVKVTRTPLHSSSACTTISCIADQFKVSLAQEPLVISNLNDVVDTLGNTAFFAYTNQRTRERLYVKIIVGNNYIYRIEGGSSETVNGTMEPVPVQQIVGSFTLIR